MNLRNAFVAGLLLLMTHPAFADEWPLAPRAVDLTYEPRKLVDPTSRLDVATLLVPQGWQLEPGVWWRPTNAQFVTLVTTVFDPRTGWAARWIPIDQFSCDPTLFANARQQGVPPFSGGMELTDAVLDAQQYVQRVVLPRYRANERPRVVTAENLPKLAQSVDQSKGWMRAAYRQMGREIQYSAARVRVEYAGPGGAILEEEIYCVMNCSWDVQGVAVARQMGLSGSYWFAPERIYSFTAPKGQLDLAAPYLQTIVGSMRPTLRWTAFYTNIQAMIGKIQIDAHAIEMAGRQEITDSQRKTAEDGWRSADQQSRDVGALLRGTQARSDPNNPEGPPIAGPAGKKSWVNPQGQWRHLEPKDDPNDPTTFPGTTREWKMAPDIPN